MNSDARRAVAIVEENRTLAPGVHVLVLKAPGWAAKTAPGQFAMIRAPGPEPLLARPMAFMTASENGASFGMKVVGRGTSALSALRPGQELIVWGPLGIGFSAPAPGEKAVLVGGGIGVPPLVLQAAALGATRIQRVIVGARSAGELFGREEFRRLGISPSVCTDDGSEGHHGFVTALLATETLDANTVIQACGPTPMLIAVAKIAAEAKVRCELSLEARMGCGVGACRGCMIPVSAQAKTLDGAPPRTPIARFALDGAPPRTPIARFAGKEYLCLCLDGPVVDAADIDLVRLAGIH